MSSLPAAARLQNALHAASVETDLAYVDRHVIAMDRLLGCGGFGAVYAGYRRDDAGVWRDAAIKMLMVPMPRQLESVVGVAQQAGLESRLSLCVRGGHTVCTGRAFAKLSLDCVCVPLERCEETLADLLRRKPMGGLSVTTSIWKPNWRGVVTAKGGVALLCFGEEVGALRRWLPWVGFPFSRSRGPGAGPGGLACA